MMLPVIRSLRIPTPRPALALALAAASLWSGFDASREALAQPANPAVLRPPEQDEDTLIKAKAVDVLSRAVLKQLRAAENPSREDFRGAALGLRIIRRLAPHDPDLLRLEIEAWSTAGDEEEALRGTRALLRLDPTDEIAQLRVAIAGLDQLQDVDARLRAYERLLGPRGRVIDPAVRSRLALDASLLAHDNGNVGLFLEHLTRATSLDPTNKGAAALFGTYVLGRSDDPMERVEVLCNIVLSDPLDSGAYENLALELLGRGAYAGALRAYMLATQIAVAGGWRMSPERIFDLALCEWRVRGPLRAVGRINKVLQDSVMAQAMERERLRAEGLPVPPERPQYLPPELDLMRLAIAVSQQNEEGIKTVLDAYLTAGGLQLAQIRSREADSPEEAGQLAAMVQGLKLQHLWAMLFSRQRLDEARALFDEIVAEDELARRAGQAEESSSAEGGEEVPEGEDAPAPDVVGEGLPPPLPAPVLQRFRGWLAMVGGNDREAELLLEPLVEEDVNARWALAVLREQQGNEREAMLHFARIAQSNPRSALSAAAWYRLVALRGEPVAPPEEVRELDRYVLNFAPWLNDLASDPASFMSLRASHESLTIDPLGVVVVEVTVRNVSGWPLGVGAGRPIPKRVLLAPRLRLKGRDATDLTDPTVAQIQNRLRLEPAEAVTVRVTPTRGRLGALLDLAPGALASLRWQAVQGFTKGADPGFRAGAMTVTTMSDILVRESLDESAETEEVVSLIRSLEGADLLRSVLVARRKIVVALAESADPETARVLSEAVAERLPSMDPLVQSIVLAWFGETRVAQEERLTAGLREALPDPGTYAALALLAGFDAAPDDPLLQRLVASDDDDLSRLAFIRREMLRDREGETGEEAPPSDAGTSAP